MWNKAVLSHLLYSLTFAVNTSNAIRQRDTVNQCPQEGSHQELEITEFSYGELVTHPGDIPPRLSTADVSFFVTNAFGRQACSGTIVQQQNGEWQDADGSGWFKCGTASTPDPTCSNCTHFQFGWGHESWSFAVNQTWPCTDSNDDRVNILGD
ncbi:hypothetical protein M426DRAFT_24241 [Hypoxylon sp. CI-4A]|nr:hypothetical protein M426DRAFT_24241 [Hypoxylon sp. CI-4A]